MIAGILGAGIMAAVSGKRLQILALSTMFTEDVFTFYGGVALRRSGAGADGPSVRRDSHDSGVLRRAPGALEHFRPGGACVLRYAALSVLLFAALFWRRSTKRERSPAVWTGFAVVYTSVYWVRSGGGD